MLICSMFKITRLLPLAMCATVLVTTTACASGPYYRARVQVVDRDDRAYYDRGFREGRSSGADDARRGRGYDIRRHNEYRNDRRGDDRSDLGAFRRGFEAGYDEGFRMNARRDNGGNRRDFPSTSYPNQSPSGSERGRFTSAARDAGYRDGVEAGERAARRGERFDPVREGRYREGDHDYDRRFGSRDDYKLNYRDAFRQGYDAGYRGRQR